MEKSDEVLRIKPVRNFDEQNFDELSYVFIRATKNKYYCGIITWSRGLRNVAVCACMVSTFIRIRGQLIAEVSYA